MMRARPRSRGPCVAACVGGEEFALVGHADDLPEAVIAGYRAGAPDGINSLHADRLAGRPMELDARNGVIVRRGALYGIPTPANAMIVALINAAASKA